MLTLLAAPGLAGCARHGPPEDIVAGLDRRLAGDDRDPAVTSALSDPIATDRALATQSNRNAIRPAETLAEAQYPGHVPAAAAPPCVAARLEEDPAWARRLPPAFAFYPGGRLSEAAGADANGCEVRAIRFASADDWRRLLGWYDRRAVRAGYSTAHRVRDGEQVLGGVNPSDGGAFYLIVTPGRDSTQVSLIATRTR
jgi:hypothetical protein